MVSDEDDVDAPKSKPGHQDKPKAQNKNMQNNSQVLG